MLKSFLYGHFALMTLIVFMLAPRNNLGAAESLTNAVRISGEVIEVIPIPERETVQRIRWQVVVKIVGIEQGATNAKVGDTVTIGVHSIVKTFLCDRESIKGKTYKITFHDAYSMQYIGKISVEDHVPRSRKPGEDSKP